jgi:hypothetical protein
MKSDKHFQTLPGFQALDGCNCLMSSFRRICTFNGIPHSEEMILGLGAGMGFAYWHQKGSLPMLGGRGNVFNFHKDLSARTGIQMVEHATTSVSKAEKEMRAILDSGQPVCLYADMAYLPYLGLPSEAHFGEHAIVVAGLDAESQTAVISDIDPQMTGVKAGGFHSIRLDQLAAARSSRFHPFPPRNRWFTFNFTGAKTPEKKDIVEAIAQMAYTMLHPPIKNLGVIGIKTAAQKVKKWPEILDARMLKVALFNLYTFTEIGGTGGGLFRFLYSRFLAEASELTGISLYRFAGQEMDRCANLWRELAQPFKNIDTVDKPEELIPDLAKRLDQLSEVESDIWLMLEGASQR